MAAEWISKKLEKIEKAPLKFGGFFVLIIYRLESTHGKEKIII